ncbi:type II secretion system F family protein [Candidatus Uhrbacteria bacterium]|nr:type II secretion system F family protein [Candidatus Uhrbacteria bacterium]
MKNQKKSGHPSRKKSALDITLGGVSVGQRALLARHLAIMLKAGLSLTEALHIAQDSAVGKMKLILDDIFRSVTSGRSFVDTLADHKKEFSELFVSAVRAGEVSGTLEQNLEHLALQLEKDKDLSSKVKGALLYPMIVLIATFILGMVIAFYVLPQIVPLFIGLKVSLPITTQILIAFSRLIEQSGGTVFAGIVFFVIAALWLVRQRFIKPYTHWILLHAPLAGPLARATNLARFSRTLGMLLKSGLRIDEAMAIMKEILGNVYYQRVIIELERRVTKGSTMYENLQRYPQLFPLVAVHMVRVGEESGRLEDTLLYLGEYYENEVDSAIKNLSTVIEPLLLLFIGGAVGFLALSIITPIYSITGGVHK